MPVIVITGASQGIGAAVAEAFANAFAAESTTGAGANIALVARNADRLEAVARACRAAGADAQPFVCDVTDDAAVEAMAQDVTARWGAPDVVVNNAGLFVPGTIKETSPADFRTQVEVNLTSAFLVTRAFLDGMTARKRGHLFYMASVASIRAYPAGAAYCAAKHGLLGLARSVREETKPHGLRVTTLLPGPTYTPSWEGVDLPEERFMPASDIAAALVDVYRLSDRTVVEELILRPQLGDIG